MQYLSSWPGIRPTPPAVEVRSLNYWMAREVPLNPSEFMAFDELFEWNQGLLMLGEGAASTSISSSEVWSEVPGFPGGTSVKDSTCHCRRQGLIPVLGRSLEEGMATHSSIVAWRVPWTEEPDGPQPIGSQGVGHDWSNLIYMHTQRFPGFPGGATVKNPPANVGDARVTGSIPGSRKAPGGGNDNQYSCLGNSMDRGAWQATVHGFAKSQTWLCTHIHTEVPDPEILIPWKEHEGGVYRVLVLVSTQNWPKGEMLSGYKEFRRSQNHTGADVWTAWFLLQLSSDSTDLPLYLLMPAGNFLSFGSEFQDNITQLTV